MIEVNFVVLIGQGSRVDNKDGDPLSEAYCDVVTTFLHSLLHTIQRPSWIVAQHPGGKFGRLFDADAAVAEITASARKELG